MDAVPDWMTSWYFFICMGGLLLVLLALGLVGIIFIIVRVSSGSSKRDRTDYRR